jgi:hypothetical protein
MTNCVLAFFASPFDFASKGGIFLTLVLAFFTAATLSKLYYKELKRFRILLLVVGVFLAISSEVLLDLLFTSIELSSRDDAAWFVYGYVLITSIALIVAIWIIVMAKKEKATAGPGKTAEGVPEE